MAKKTFQAGTVDYIAVLFRHLDRQSDVLSTGLGITQNQNLLTSYYSMCMHLEALLTPHLDQEYYEKADVLHKEMPHLGSTMTTVFDAVRFLRWCSKWMRLMVNYMHREKLLRVQASNWTMMGDGEEISTNQLEE